jgi:hypothetical protein
MILAIGLMCAVIYPGVAQSKGITSERLQYAFDVLLSVVLALRIWLDMRDPKLDRKLLILVMWLGAGGMIVSQQVHRWPTTLILFAPSLAVYIIASILSRRHDRGDDTHGATKTFT